MTNELEENIPSCMPVHDEPAIEPNGIRVDWVGRLIIMTLCTALSKV
jgi:hypothetical protein